MNLLLSARLGPWALALGLAGPVAAQEPTEAVWRFGDEALDFPTLVQICSKALGRVIEYDPATASGTVWLSSAALYTNSDIWALLNRELVVKGATTVQPPGSESLRVVPIAAAFGMARLEEPGLVGSQAGYLKVLAPLQHRSAKELAETVSSVLSAPHGKAAVVADANALVIADFGAHVHQALELIDLLDHREVEPAVEEFPLEHLAPLSMGSLLERVTNSRAEVIGSKLRGRALTLPESKSVLVVAPEEEMAWWRDMVERFDRPEPVFSQQYTPRRFGLAETANLVEDVVHSGGPQESPGAWRLVADELTGTLIITASPSRHREVQELLNRLESTELGARKPLRAFTLRNRQVSDVLALLQDLLEAGAIGAVEEGSGGDPAARGATGAIPATLRRPGQGRSSQGQSKVTLAADEGTNRILAFGPASMLDQVGALVETLDVRHDQVLVETLVVVLNDDQTKALGVELQRIGAQGDALVGVASLFGLGSPDPTASTLPSAGGSGFSTTVLAPGDYSAVVRALQTVSQGRSLTVPKVLVNNNAEATLDSTLQTPYASTNASNTVATTSFGGTFDAGTAITVKPQIADGDQIVMDYSVSLSRFTGEAADPNLPPPRQETSLKSTVTVPDGHTIVVGGLEIDSETDTVAQVPVLGQVPLLGHLFRDRSRTKSKSRFFVFLRCTVMHSETFEDLKYQSGRDMLAAEVDDGWPKLEPRVIR